MSVMHLCAIALHFEFAYNVTRIRNCGNRLCKFYAVYLNNCAILLLISSKHFNELYALRTISTNHNKILETEFHFKLSATFDGTQTRYKNIRIK